MRFNGGVKNTIYDDYKGFIYDNLYNGIYPRLIAAFIIITFFIYSDIHVIRSEESVYARLIVILITFTTLFIRLFSINKAILFKSYNILLLSTYFMMFFKILIHMDHHANLNSSIMGMIVVLFIVSLELKLRPIASFLIYVIPFAIFMLILFLLDTTFGNIHKITINIIPMILVGFVANTIHNKMRYKLFETSQLLKIEKDKVDIQNQELIKIDASKNKLFSIISHDLKSPFNTIVGFSELLAADYDKYSEEVKKKYINLIHQSSKKAFGLLVDLLNWSYLQLDGLRLKPEMIELKSFVDGELEITKIMASKKNISVYNNIDDGLHLIVDKFSISTIIRNLINNSIKFSNYGDPIDIYAKVESRYVVFTVQDYGIGIPKEKIEHLFSFENKYTTLGTEMEKGSGLGLAICKDLVEINSGQISVKSELEKGSVFTFSLRINKN